MITLSENDQAKCNSFRSWITEPSTELGMWALENKIPN